jgi:hypothetical protein
MCASPDSPAVAQRASPLSLTQSAPIQGFFMYCPRKAHNLSIRPTKVLSDRMSDYEFTISLSIRHPRIDPARITEQLGVEPQHTWRAGDARRAPGGDELGGVYRESYWMGRLMDEPQTSSERLSVETLLRQLLAQLHRSQRFLEQLNADGGVAELGISLFARKDFRLELASELLAAAERLRLGIVFEVHPHPNDRYLEN